ncbi:hypothetical protein Acr_00g0043150 [Actinidia rufa]|uniref:Uncharacterized protein n=1 Tax=Actinidia rufa TaxID=165716 RepID=A0A7J0DKA4_9ERIC|nr:hypothetical protein Acr_00g0043150 [Actinidia rufa]
MEQGTHTNHLQTSLPDLFGDEELVIGEILRCFPELVLEYDLRKWVLFDKGNRGKRRKRTRFNWSLESLLNYFMKNHEDEREKAREPKFIGNASSPDTPLNFPSTEPDEKSEDSLRKISKERKLLQTDDESLVTIDELIKKKKDIEKLSLSLENHKVEVINSINASENQDQHQVHCMVHHQPSIVDRTVCGSQRSAETLQTQWAQISPVLASGSGSGKAQYMDPLGIDLTKPAGAAFGVDSSQPLDHGKAFADNRAIPAAEASRRGVIKIKARKNPLATKS